MHLPYGCTCMGMCVVVGKADNIVLGWVFCGLVLCATIEVMDERSDY